MRLYYKIYRVDGSLVDDVRYDYIEDAIYYATQRLVDGIFLIGPSKNWVDCVILDGVAYKLEKWS